MSDQRRVTDLQLEQLALGELPEDLAREVRARLEREPALRQRLEVIAASDREGFVRYPATEVMTEVARRRRASGAGGAAPDGAAARDAARRRRLAWLGAPALAAAAVAALLVVVLPGGPAPPDDLTKGARPRLLVHRQTPAGPTALEDGVLVAAGETIQLSYAAAGYTHGVLLSIDGRGTVTLHFPVRETASTALQPGGVRPLARSYKLDDAPRFERFFLVVSHDPLDVAAVFAAARGLAGTPDRARTAPLAPGLAGVAEASFLVRKSR